MSIVPRIETPCPLSAAEQRAVDGHCDRCDRQVHRLDDLGEAARRALFAAASGPLCVSYRAPHRVGRIGAAIAATLITAGAYAADPIQQTTTPQSSTAQPATETPASAKAERSDPTTGTRIKREPPKDDKREPLTEFDEVLVVGAVNDPQDARQPEDKRVPALPSREVAQPQTGTRIKREEREPLSEFDEVLVVGAVNDPQDAQQPEDKSVPALPVRDALDAVEEDDVLAVDEDIDIVFVGGVSDPANAEWIDSNGLADLPVVDHVLDHGVASKDGR